MNKDHLQPASFTTTGSGADISKDFQALSAPLTDGPVPLIALEDDFYKIAGQAYAVLSFIDQSQYAGLRLEGSMSQPVHLIKLRGTFGTKEAAEKHVKQCQAIDTYFDYHIVETHKWTTVGASTGGEQEWQDDMVNDAMQGYFEKENDTLGNLQARIKLAQDGGEERSGEATKFYEDSQKCAVEGAGSTAPEMPAGFTRMSLEAARSMTAVN